MIIINIKISFLGTKNASLIFLHELKMLMNFFIETHVLEENFTKTKKYNYFS